MFFRFYSKEDFAWVSKLTLKNLEDLKFAVLLHELNIDKIKPDGDGMRVPAPRKYKKAEKTILGDRFRIIDKLIQEKGGNNEQE